MQVAEKRQSPRCAVPTFVPQGSDPEAMYTLDLSRTGMRFVELSDRPGAELQQDDVRPAVYALTVPLPGTGRLVHALAETVRVDVRGPVQEVAVRFRYLPPEDQRCLDAYLSARNHPSAPLHLVHSQS